MPEQPPERGPGLRYRYVVRITAADVGQRVVLRWRRPTADGGEEVTDVLGQLETADSEGFAVRTRAGELVSVPRSAALAGKVVPPRPW